MKKYLAILIFFLIIACHSEERPSFENLQTDFVATINQNKKGADYYCRQGALFVQHKIYKSRDSIHEQLQELPIIDTSFSSTIIKHDSSNYFDVGYYQLKDTTLGKLAYMVAWKEEKGIWCKELEVLYPIKITNKIGTQAIDAARQHWEDWSNEHQPDALIERLYDTNGVYLNDGYIYKGRKAIQTKYSYMLKEQWHIRLSSIQTVQVSDSLFYDVGQYVSSGKGHYFILWQLQSDSTWRVLLDFNF
ncbi:MAG: Unknown protein [uncultured Aureispira sp.]|uniref:DUF4440 domain-containing protein n=1 Tax=uncultured Aureispira sp. TaxID=1331704 RepID=A0A6S6SGI2_9BACT|nr:MAG: Unknown protein [uncultured Aureispira sp.]